MNISFDKATPFTDEQISKVEVLFGAPLSEEVKQFYLEHGGSEPNIAGGDCGFIIENADGWQTESVIYSVPSYLELETALKQNYLEYLKEYVASASLEGNKLNYKDLFPVFNLPNGAVYIAVSGEQEGKVYTADSGDMGLVYNSADLSQFLSKLYKLPD